MGVEVEMVLTRKEGYIFLVSISIGFVDPKKIEFWIK